MSPEYRDWLTAHEIDQRIDEKLKPVMLRLDFQDRQLAEISARQQAYHDENRRKLDNALQLGENQLALMRGQETATKEYRRERKEHLDRLGKTGAWILSPAFLAGAWSLIRHIYAWIATGHL